MVIGDRSSDGCSADLWPICAGLRGPPRCELQLHISDTNDVYAREVVMARVGHLIRRKQREIERITRILRAFFDPGQVQAPEPGRIKRIILIGPRTEERRGGQECVSKGRSRWATLH